MRAARFFYRNGTIVLLVVIIAALAFMIAFRITTNPESFMEKYTVVSINGTTYVVQDSHGYKYSATSGVPGVEIGDVVTDFEINYRSGNVILEIDEQGD